MIRLNKFLLPLSILLLINCTVIDHNAGPVSTPTAVPTPMPTPTPIATPTPEPTVGPTPAYTFEFGPLESVYRGLYLKEYPDNDRSTYFSESVSHELVIDLHDHILETQTLLNSELNTSLEHDTDLYLIENTESFNKVRKFLNINSGGFQPAGFFIAACNPNPIAIDRCYGGIYADLSTGDYSWQLRMVSHEYTHSFINKTLNERWEVLAIWLNEGLAQWIENKVVPHDGGYWARLAAEDDTLFPLSSLERVQDWNRRSGEDVNLQYSQAQMAVTYFIEEFGGPKLLELITDSTRSGSVDFSMRALIGIGYQEFQNNLTDWLKGN